MWGGSSSATPTFWVGSPYAHDSFRRLAMDELTRRRVCELIAGVIATDDNLHPEELHFMLKTFKAFGIATGEDDEAICPAVSAQEAANAMSSLPPDVREEAVELLVASAAADGVIADEERTYLSAVAKAAGLTHDDVQRRLDEAVAKRLRS